MAYTVPSIADFKARFPEYADIPDAAVTLAIADATRFVTTEWPEVDYPTAILFLAAHFIYMAQIGSEGDIGELVSRLRSISYGPMAIGFSGTPAVSGGSASSEMTTSIYLERYLMLQPRPWGPIVLDGSTGLV